MLIKFTLLVVFLCIFVDIGKCGCQDDESLIFPFNGQNMSCSEYLALKPCDCKKTFKNSLGADVVVKRACCLSCKDADLSECNCQNLASAANPIEFGETILNSCEEMRDQVPELCKQLGKKKNTPCCKACKDVSLNCLDTRLKVWNSQTGDNLNCAQLIAEDKCHCEMVKKDCCASCKSLDLSDCCLNDPDFKASVRTKGNKKMKIPMKKCKMCTCDEILEADPTGVLMDIACRKNIRNAQKRCCKNCAAVGAPN